MRDAARDPNSDRTSDDDRHLVERMRRFDSEALRTYFDRYRPLLLQEARRIGVQPALVSEKADECLGDVVLRLMRYTTPVPRALAPYLVRALRLHCLQARRGERRRHQAEARDDDDADGMGSTLLSQFARREHAGPDAQEMMYSPALRKLANALDETMSDAERLMMLWVGEAVPQSVIAEWLGVSHGAVRNRIMRLRARLHDDATFFVSLYDDEERTEIAAFFRRMQSGRHGQPNGAGDEQTKALGGAPTGVRHMATRRASRAAISEFPDAAPDTATRKEKRDAC